MKFYRTHSDVTEPGEYAHVFDGLTLDIPGLCEIIQGLMIHRDSIALYDRDLAEERKGQAGDVHFKAVSAMLAEVVRRSDEPIHIKRDIADRLAVVCRDFAVLMCSMLRHLNVPARTRTIFPSYFKLPDKYNKNFYYDHWICEYWDDDELRWIVIDAQLNDAEKSEYCSIEINNCDIPYDSFMYSGKAWQLHRSGIESADSFGEPESPSHGYDLLRRHMLLDFASLNKLELFAWTDLGIRDVSTLDRIADLTVQGDGAFVELQNAFIERRFI